MWGLADCKLFSLLQLATVVHHGEVRVNGDLLVNVVRAFGDVPAAEQLLRKRNLDSCIQSRPPVASHHISAQLYHVDVLFAIATQLVGVFVDRAVWADMRNDFILNAVNDAASQPAQPQAVNEPVEAPVACADAPDALAPEACDSAGVESLEGRLRLAQMQAAKLQRALSVSKQRLKKSNTSVIYWKKISDRVRAKVETQKQEAVVSKFKRGPAGRYFTGRGGLCMAARRCVGNIAAQNLGLVLGVDLHPKTIGRWELRLRASLLACMRRFHRDMCATISEPTVCTAPGLKIGMHGIRADATTAKVWQHGKIHVTEVQSVYVTRNIYVESSWEQVRASMVEKKMLSDLQQVGPGSSSARGMLGMTEKQVQSLALHVPWVPQTTLAQLALEGPVDPPCQIEFEDRPCDLDAAMAAHLAVVPVAVVPVAQGLQAPQTPQSPEGLRETIPLTLHWWYVTTDAGSDIAAGRRRLASQIAPVENAALFDIDCLSHQFQLITKRQLFVMDDVVRTLKPPCGLYRYYSSLAMIFHVWRDNARDIFARWCGEFGCASAITSCSKVPPRPIAGLGRERDTCRVLRPNARAGGPRSGSDQVARSAIRLGSSRPIQAIGPI